MTKGWRRDTYTNRLTGRVIAIEVIPEQDTKPHVSDEMCACCPVVKTVNGAPMLVHNSFDGREKFEGLRDQ